MPTRSASAGCCCSAAAPGTCWAAAAMNGCDAAVELIAGGLLTSYLSWRWVPFVNVPIGILTAAGAPFALADSARRRGRFDLASAVTGTVGVASLVYGLSNAGTDQRGVSQGPCGSLRGPDVQDHHRVGRAHDHRHPPVAVASLRLHAPGPTAVTPRLRARRIRSDATMQMLQAAGRMALMAPILRPETRC
jgi:hypothetical protein